MNRTPDEVWSAEAAYFDAQANTRNIAEGLNPAVLERYRRPTRFWFNKEYRFRLLGDVQGKRVLDVGCGLGDNAILLASFGARVTGVDVSQASIETARRRAARVAPPPEFICAPLETAELPDGSFDVIWGDGVLHHLLHDLDGAMTRLARAAREGAVFLFSEPVDRVPGMRRLRLSLPITVDGTPDERPLVERELTLVRRHVPDLRIRPFSFVGRLNRFVLRSSPYETAASGRRAVADALCLADWCMLGLPGFARLGGMVVLHGHFSRRALGSP